MKLNHLSKIFTIIFAFTLSNLVFGFDIPLYPTGPSQDSAFIRFVNGGDTTISLTSGGSKAKVNLENNNPSTLFYPVATKSSVTGEFSNGKTTSPISVNVKPGEFTSVLALSNSFGLKQIIIKEQPSDFNSLKSSLALYNFIPNTCNDAGLIVINRSITLFENVKTGTFKRRLLNPVNIDIQLTCDGKPQGNVLKLENLQAGLRYSVFATPSEKGNRIFFLTDSIAR
jgi:hypothetical protein